MTSRSRRYTLLGFDSTHDALDAEALLGDLGIEVVPIPAPKVLGSLCGIALRIDPRDYGKAQRYLQNARIAIKSQAEVEDV